MRSVPNTRTSVVATTESSPRRNHANTAAKPAATTRIQPAARDRTPGPSTANATKANPMEIRKMENQIKDKETEITRMTAQIKSL